MCRPLPPRRAAPPPRRGAARRCGIMRLHCAHAFSSGRVFVLPGCWPILDPHPSAPLPGASRAAMDPATGEAVPTAALRAELCGADAAAAVRGLASLARAQAAGADVSALAAECLPRLALSDELPLPARRMACDVLRHCALSGTLFCASNPRVKPCAALRSPRSRSGPRRCGVGGAGCRRRRRHRLRGASRGASCAHSVSAFF
jgi:hypothetical protein